MLYTQLSEDLKVSEMQFGCSRLGKAVKEDTSKIGPHILEHAFEKGINFFDTAANYAYGTSEKILGDFAKGKRDDVVIVTKGGTLLSKKANAARFLNPIYKIIRPIIKRSKSLKKHKKRYNFDFKFLSQTLDGSLKRMSLEYVDVYLLHSPSDEVLRNPKTGDFLNKLKKEGKTRLTGHSFTNIDDMKHLTSWDNVDVIQVPLNYHVFKEEHYTLLKDVKNRGIKIIGRSPFERGMLTKYNEMKTGRRTGMVDHEMIKKKRYLQDHYGISEIQLALWFVKDLGLADNILFSSFNKDHINQNIDAFQAKIASDFSWKSVLI